MDPTNFKYEPTKCILTSFMRLPKAEETFDMRPCVVSVRNATKSFGNSKVIDGLNMTIRQGTIYSFLGSSGCGKTTTLSCIIGLNKFTSGKVLVFGKEPGERNSGVPGKSVGYMPQEYSLYNQFSIDETLMYFGKMNGMSECEICKALIFYSDLLQLPEHSKSVISLSGGEKRRVSFVVAIMHNPPLLILDEPTVAVDPLIRESILKHLTQLARSHGTTVIITTHYIEGARDSDTIGVMRNGRLVAEKSPQELLSEFRQTSLESVVLQLCKADNPIRPRPEISNLSADLIISTGPSPHVELNDTELCKRKILNESYARTKALVRKNICLWKRSLWMLYMSIIFPATGLLVTYYCFGNPKYVNLGVVNEELNGSATCEHFKSNWNRSCDVSLWSCRYLDKLIQPHFILHGYGTIEEAKVGVRFGDIKGLLYFPPKFSDDLFERAISGIEVDPQSFNTSNIIVHLDKSNRVISTFAQHGFLSAFSNFLREIFEDCNLDPERAKYSLDYKEPILGKDLTISDFVMPAAFLGQMFFLPIISTGVQFVNDKREGTMHRSMVAGTHLWEVFLSYIVTETGVSFLRMAWMYGIATFILGIQVSGPILPKAGLGLLIATSGMSLGFLFGVFCTEEVQVALLAVGTYMPNMILSAMIWPLEGMPLILQKVVCFLPCTLPFAAMRSMMNRGWGLGHDDVGIGFVVSISYVVVIFLIVIVVSMRNKNNSC